MLIGFLLASSQELAAKLQAGFQYGNNSDLCGAGLPVLRPCTPADLIDPDRPQPFSAGIAPQVTPSAGNGRAPSTRALAAVVVAAVALLAATGVDLFALSWRLWHRQRIAGRRRRRGKEEMRAVSVHVFLRTEETGLPSAERWGRDMWHS